MTKHREVRWTVVKDYYKDDQNYTDTWCILYGSREDAEAAKAQIETGYDKSWYDPAGNEYAGFEAFLYVDQITI